MKSNTIRRILIYGTGVMMGLMIVLIMNQIDDQVPKEKQVDRIVVSISACDLKIGDILEETCIESRPVERQFIPPDTMSYERRKLFIGQKLFVELKKGSAIREADFKASDEKK